MATALFAIGTTQAWVVVTTPDLAGNWGIFTLKTLVGDFNTNYYVISSFAIVVLLIAAALRKFGVRGLPPLVHYSPWLAVVGLWWDVYQAFQGFGIQLPGISWHPGIGLWMSAAAAVVATVGAIMDGSMYRV